MNVKKKKGVEKGKGGGGARNEKERITRSKIDSEKGIELPK